MSGLQPNQMIIKNARIAFPDLFKAVEYEAGDGKPRYGAQLLLPKDDPQIAIIWGIAEKLFKEQFPKGKEAEIYLNAGKGAPKSRCINDGDTKVYDGYAGNMFITAHRRGVDGPPLVKTRDMKSDVREEDGIVYSGCYVNAKVNFWVQDNKNGKGLRCGLEVIQFVRDGTAFSSAAPATADGMEPEPEEDPASMV